MKKQYQGVKIEPRTETKDKYSATFIYGGVKHFKVYLTELDAAIGYDMMRMEKGLSPVNELSSENDPRKYNNVKLLYINGCELFTSSRKEINKYVKKGRTVLIDDELTAVKESRKMNSYYYPVYNSYNQSVGFAIPK